MSRVKAGVFCSLQKITDISKTDQLIPRIGTAILGVREPHFKHFYNV